MVVRMVAARSWAEMPVVVLYLASMDTQKAVWKELVFSWTIMGIWSSSRRWPVMARQMRPRPWVAMKVMASGVTFSAGR